MRKGSESTVQYLLRQWTDMKCIQNTLNPAQTSFLRPSEVKQKTTGQENHPVRYISHRWLCLHSRSESKWWRTCVVIAQLHPDSAACTESPSTFHLSLSTSDWISGMLRIVSRAWTSVLLAQVTPDTTQVCNDSKARMKREKSSLHLSAAGSSPQVRLAKLSHSAWTSADPSTNDARLADYSSTRIPAKEALLHLLTSPVGALLALFFLPS